MRDRERPRGNRVAGFDDEGLEAPPRVQLRMTREINFERGEESSPVIDGYVDVGCGV
jgi:hypothetical protein